MSSDPTTIAGEPRENPVLGTLAGLIQGLARRESHVANRHPSIAIEMARHLHPLADGQWSPDSIATGLFFVPFTVVMILAAIMNSLWPWVIVCIVFCPILVITDGAELCRSMATWFRSNPLTAVLKSIGCLALLFAMAPLFVPQSVFRKYVRRRRERDVLPLPDLPLPFEKPRLLCRGEPEELRHACDLRDVPFEPVIVQYSSWTDTIGHYWKVVLPVFLLVTFGPLLVLLLMGVSFGNIVSTCNVWLMLVTSLATVIVAWLIKWLYPTYYRVVPGRLDIVRYKWWADRARSIERFDLREARKIEVNYANQNVVIEAAPSEPDCPVIYLSHIRERHRLAEAILMAAISTSPAPPLPDDELLG